MPTPLPVIQVLRETLQFVWDKKVRLLRALIVPMTALLVLENAFTLSNDNPWRIVQGVLLLAVYAAFAISCHRLALLGDNGVPAYGFLKWTKREWQYLGWLLVIMIIFMLYSFVINSLFVSIIIRDVEAGATVESFQSIRMGLSLLYIPLLYMITRLSVLYPAIAVDEHANSQWAWRTTAHNGWRLALVVWILPGILYYLLNALLRENATLAEYAVFRLAGFVLLAVEMIALSFSYKHLEQNETDPVASVI